LIGQDGFAIVPGVFARDEIAELVSALPELNGAAGTRGLLDLPWCRNLSQDPKILGPVQDAIGPNAVAVRGILFDKNPTSNWNLGWHQDTKIAVRQRVETEGFTAWSEKEGVVHCQPPLSVLEASVAVRIHLDPCGADNGPLQVLPGSHLLGISKEAPEDLLPTAESCLANVGDVILMKPLTWHASSKASSPNHRRVIHLEYCAAELPNGLEWAYALGHHG